MRCSGSASECQVWSRPLSPYSLSLVVEPSNFLLAYVLTMVESMRRYLVLEEFGLSPYSTASTRLQPRMGQSSIYFPKQNISPTEMTAKKRSTFCSSHSRAARIVRVRSHVTVELGFASAFLYYPVELGQIRAFALPLCVCVWFAARQHIIPDLPEKQ